MPTPDNTTIADIGLADRRLADAERASGQLDRRAQELPPYVVPDAMDEVPAFDWGGYPLADEEAMQPPRFVAEDCDTVCGRDGDWLVKSLWPRVGLCFLAGPSMAGKSFLALELMSCLAKGIPVLNGRALRTGVAYIAAEGANGVRTRVEGLRRKSGNWSGHMHFIGDAPNLCDKEDVGKLQEKLLALKRELVEKNIRLGAVVVDTLSASIPGADENTASDMSPVLLALQNLATALDACVLVIAHVGKDADRGIRGWSGLLANADGVIKVDAPDDAGTRVVTVQKVKDGEAGGRFAFGLEVIALRHDTDGDEVTTCTVVWRDPPEPNSKSKRKSTIKPGMHLILTALQRLGDGVDPDDTAARSATHGMKTVALKQLQTAAFEDGFGGVDPEEEPASRRWKDSRRKSFTNQLGYLARDGYVRSEGGFVWRV